MSLQTSISRRSLLRFAAGAAGGLACTRGLFAQKLNAERMRQLLAGRRLLIVPYTHIDWAWVHSRQWQADRAALALSEVLDILKTMPEFRFFVDTWNEEVEPFLDRCPGRLAEFRKAVAAGQIAVCGGMVANQHPGWMETESLVRNLVIGRRIFEKVLPGWRPEIMVHYDVMPGPAQMPQILNKAGYRGYRACRPDEALTAEGVPRNFIWEGLDGTEMLVSRGDYGGFVERRRLGDFQKSWDDGVVRFYQSEVERNAVPHGGDSVWVPMGADDIRPLRSGTGWDHGDEAKLPIPEFVREWNEREKVPLRFATPVEYFRALEPERLRLPRHKGVLEPTMWTYWYGLNGNNGLRLWRSRADAALVAAEKLWACAASLGEAFPEAEFDALWHDLLRTYSHAQMWLFKADYAAHLDLVKATLKRAEELCETAIQRLAGRVNVDPGRSAVLLFNTLAWERTEVAEVQAQFQQPGYTNVIVRDARGSVIPHQVVDVNDEFRASLPDGKRQYKEAVLLIRARVPALGYTVLYFDPARGQMAPPATETRPIADAGSMSVALAGKGIEWLLDRRTGLRYPGAGNIIYNEIRETNALHYGPVTRTFRWSDAHVGAVIAGPLRTSFTVAGALGPHRAELTAHLYTDAQRVAFEAVIESVGGAGHFMTTVGLPGRGRLAAGVHFGVEERDLSKVAYKGIERLRKNVFYGHHWADWTGDGGGVAVLASTGERGYQYFPEENALGHFLLMTNPPASASGWERFVTDAREGRGRHVFDYQFLLHAGDWNEGGVTRRALEAETPLIAVARNQPQASGETLPAERTFLAVSPAHVQVSALYREGGRYLVRLYESVGAAAEVALELPLAPTSVHNVNFHGAPRPRNIAVSRRTVRFKVRPWEIVTLAFS